VGLTNSVLTYKNKVVPFTSIDVGGVLTKMFTLVVFFAKASQVDVVFRLVYQVVTRSTECRSHTEIIWKVEKKNQYVITAIEAMGW
jgi:hypothetical protein